MITNVNQWKVFSTAIEWLNNFEKKKSVIFMVFNIKTFYPSISENLFIKTIQFAKQITN